jgi:hypothetical protein
LRPAVAVTISDGGFDHIVLDGDGSVMRPNIFSEPSISENT